MSTSGGGSIQPALVRIVLALLSLWGVLLTFAAAVLLALGFPAISALVGLPDSSTLDYASYDGAVSPLSDAYLAELLGRPLAGLGENAVSPARSQASTLGGAAPGSSRLAGVDHDAINDDIDDALVIGALPFEGRTSAANAGRQAGEPSSCAGIGPTLWYRYAATADHILQAAAIGSGKGMAIAVFTRPGGSFRQVSCDNSLESGARTTIRARPGQEYWFQVTASGGPRQVVFSLEPLGTTERVSLATDGGDPDNVSDMPVISDDGRYVAFESWASNLVPGDTNDSVDVFVHDRATGKTERVSVASDGTEGNGNSGSHATDISANGRFVSFVSYATNLVPGDTNDSIDAFVHDRTTKSTERVSVASGGEEGRWPSDLSITIAEEAGCRVLGDELPSRKAEGHATLRGLCTQSLRTSLSDDGRFVVFNSWLAGLARDDSDRNPTNRVDRDASGSQTASANFDVFVHDRRASTTRLLSTGLRGAAGDGPSWWPTISGDGSTVAFVSTASNLVGGDTNEVSDVFVRDLRTDVVRRVSVSSSGTQADQASDWASLSRDGRYIAFDSLAGNLDGRSTAAGVWNVFVHDAVTGVTSLASVSSAGEASELGAEWSAISADGRWIAFTSGSRSLGGSRPDEFAQTYVHDRINRTTALVSVSSSGESGNESSDRASISADGRHIAFDTFATNFDPADRNAEAGEESFFYGLDVYVHSRARQ